MVVYSDAGLIEYRRKILGERLAKWRRDAGYTQKEVSQWFAYSSAQFVSNWERGVAIPPLETLAEVIRMYGLTKAARLELVDAIADCNYAYIEQKNSQMREALGG